MNTRIIQLRKALNLNQSQFAQKIKMKQGSICDMEKQRCKITDRVVNLICLTFNVNENWLRNGNGEMFINENKKYKDFFEIYKNLHPSLQDFLNKTAENLLDAQGEIVEPSRED